MIFVTIAVLPTHCWRQCNDDVQAKLEQNLDELEDSVERERKVRGKQDNYHDDDGDHGAHGDDSDDDDDGDDGDAGCDGDG